MKKIFKFFKQNWILTVSLFYIIWPLDLITEIFGPIGLIDDFFVLILVAIQLFRKFLENEKLSQNHPPSENNLNESLPIVHKE